MPINGKKTFEVGSENKELKHEGHKVHEVKPLGARTLVRNVRQTEGCAPLFGKVFMICLICRQAEIIAGLTSITFEREEFRLLIRFVPAQICPNCQEALVDEEVAIRLLSIAEDAIHEGIIEDIRDYSK